VLFRSLDNCHVRVAFATNDERTARRVSDALGTATELRAMKNYAGHRLSPWLGHLMVSRLCAAEQHRADVARARRCWMREQGLFDPARLVFIDESVLQSTGGVQHELR